MTLRSTSLSAKKLKRNPQATHSPPEPESLEEVSPIQHQDRLEDNERINNLWSTSVDIVSSTDYPFAIKDAYEKYLKETKKSLLVFAPYYSKIIVDLIRTNVREIESIKWLARLPNKKNYYWVLKTTESLKWTFGSKVVIRFKPILHLKFVVIDDKIVLSGSLNQTSSGIYYNDEILYIYKHPRDIERHIDIFYKLWNCPSNTIWKNGKDSYGYNGYNDRSPVYKKIAESVIHYFNLNGNQGVRKSVLCENIARQGFDKDFVIDVVKELTRVGQLYEPRLDWLKLTRYQTDINDFQ